MSNTITDKIRRAFGAVPMAWTITSIMTKFTIRVTRSCWRFTPRRSAQALQAIVRGNIWIDDLVLDDLVVVADNYDRSRLEILETLGPDEEAQIACEVLEQMALTYRNVVRDLRPIVAAGPTTLPMGEYVEMSTEASLKASEEIRLRSMSTEEILYSHPEISRYIPRYGGVVN